MAESTNKAGRKSRKMPAITAEAREDEMIAAAMDLAERKLRDGTAGTAIITHYLRLASMKERKQLEILEEQRKLIVAKTGAIEAEKNTEEMYKEAMAAFTEYNGMEDGDGYYDE